MCKTLKFKRSESFYIRDGWFEKALHCIQNDESHNIFSKNNGMKVLGIGSNMVKGLKYWLSASNLIEQVDKKVILTDLGKLVMKYDEYLENDFTWFLIHYYIVSNIIDSPVFNGIFNLNVQTFSKKEIVEMLSAYFSNYEFLSNDAYIEDDLNVFLKSYYNDNRNANPEDNYICPLSSLRLIDKKTNYYVKQRPSYHSLSYLIVFFALCNIYKEASFTIEDSWENENSPFKIFNLDKNMYLQYLGEMRDEKLITINKTAGLNTIYIESKLSLEDIFERYFSGAADVR